MSPSANRSGAEVRIWSVPWRPLSSAATTENALPARPLTRPERRLVAALHAGDPDALREVYAQYGATVFGYLVSALRDRAAAEDVFQLVLSEIWRRGAEYDPDRGSLTTWILTIARSRVIDELRRRRPEPLDPSVLPDDGSEPPPQDAAIERWRMAHLLAQLPAEERRLLELRFYDGLTQSEIEAQTGIALGTIKTRMVRGLERLRAMMDAEGDLER
jgi:RNA polymerase sigma-70 factor, ECF subfamily